MCVFRAKFLLERFCAFVLENCCVTLSDLNCSRSEIKFVANINESICWIVVRMLDNFSGGCRLEPH